MDEPPGVQAWFDQLYAQALVLNRLEQELLTETGLPIAWFEVLVQLGKTPRERQRMSDLARAVLLSKSAITKIVTKMEQVGLLHRDRPEDDLRSTYAVLTDRGRRALATALPIHHRGIHVHYARHLSNDDAATLSRTGRAIANAADATRAQQASIPEPPPQDLA